MCVLMLVMSIFPQIPFWFSSILGVESPANFVFLALIAVLLVSQFFLTIRVSHLEMRLQELVQAVAIDSKENKDKINRDE